MTSLWTRAGMTWRQFGMRLLRQIWEDEVLGRCAELAYVFLFSVFPLLLFLTTLLGYLAEANPSLRLILFSYLARISPSRDVTALLNDTLQEIAAARTGTKLYLSLILTMKVSAAGFGATRARFRCRPRPGSRRSRAPMSSARAGRSHGR